MNLFTSGSYSLSRKVLIPYLLLVGLVSACSTDEELDRELARELLNEWYVENPKGRAAWLVPSGSINKTYKYGEIEIELFDAWKSVLDENGVIDGIDANEVVVHGDTFYKYRLVLSDRAKQELIGEFRPIRTQVRTSLARVDEITGITFLDQAGMLARVEYTEINKRNFLSDVPMAPFYKASPGAKPEYRPPEEFNPGPFNRRMQFQKYDDGWRVVD